MVQSNIQIQSLPPPASTQILNEQRLNRPSSPHFTIYQPQLTWYGSIVHRFTGAGLGVRTCIFRSKCTTFSPIVVLYGFSIAYLFAPGTFDSAHVVEFVAGLPDAVKYGGKAILAAPFAFHSFNGLRHLSWDMGKCEYSLRFFAWTYANRAEVLTIKGVYATGYAVLGATTLSTLILTYM